MPSTNGRTGWDLVKSLKALNSVIVAVLTALLTAAVATLAGYGFGADGTVRGVMGTGTALTLPDGRFSGLLPPGLTGGIESGETCSALVG